MTQDVLLLLGKPPRPGTVVLEVVEGLRAAGAVVHVHLPHEERTRSRPAEVALVVHRGLSRSAQAEVATWQARGVRVCNPWGGTVLARDRSGTAEALAAAGVRTPVTTRATSWSDVLDLADRRRSTGGVVVKGPGSRGRGAAVLVDPLPDGAPGDGPWTVEERVPSDGTDHKLYVAGSWVGGLRKPSPLAGGHTTTGTLLDVTPPLRDVALTAARAVDLHLLGVDVVHGPWGPVVVDVNAFPGYRSVQGAGEAVTAHLLEHLADGTP